MTGEHSNTAGALPTEKEVVYRCPACKSWFTRRLAVAHLRLKSYCERKERMVTMRRLSWRYAR